MKMGMVIFFPFPDLFSSHSTVCVHTFKSTILLLENVLFKNHAAGLNIQKPLCEGEERVCFDAAIEVV